MFRRRSIIDIPIGITISLTINTFQTFKPGMPFIVIGGLAEAIRQSQQFIFLTGRMLEIGIDIRRAECPF